MLTIASLLFICWLNYLSGRGGDDGDDDGDDDDDGGGSDAYKNYLDCKCHAQLTWAPTIPPIDANRLGITVVFVLEPRYHTQNFQISVIHDS